MAEGKHETEGADYPRREAERIYESWLEASEEGQVDLGALLIENPQLESELRELHESFQAFSTRMGRVQPAPEELVPGELARLQGARAFEERYEIVAELGTGGMGAVYLALDRQLAREVAIKRPYHEGANENKQAESRRIARFLREATVIAQLDHPGVVPIHELGTDKQQRPYFVMGLAKGLTFKRVLQEAVSGSRRALAHHLEVLVAVADTVAHAHGRGIIHRDLKPSNILVGDHGQVYVLDWGLARAPGTAEPELWATAPSPPQQNSGPLVGSQVTQEHQVVGTPAYMSPEQASGLTRELTAATDVYALGAILYETLTGSPPYADQMSPGSTDPSGKTILRCIEAGPPSSPRGAMSGNHEELIAICDRAMERCPNQRYEDASGMAEDLRRFLAGRVVQAHRTGPLLRSWKWFRRNPAVGATAFVFILGTVLSSVFATRSHSARSEAEVRSLSPSVASLVEEARALWPPLPNRIPAIKDWLQRARALCESDSVKVLTRNVADLEEQASREMRPSTHLLQELRRTISNTAMRTGEGVLAQGQLRQVVQGLAPPIVVPELEPPPPGSSRDLRQEAWRFVGTGRLIFGKEAEGLALARIAEERATNPADAAEAAIAVGWAAAFCGRQEESRDAWNRARAWAPAYLEDYIDEASRRVEDMFKFLEIGEEAWQATLDRSLAHRSAAEADLTMTELRFENSRESANHFYLTRARKDIQVLSDPDTGLIDGTHENEGWGLSRRLEHARKIEALAGSQEFSLRWQEAIHSICKPNSPYGGLTLEPLAELLPLGCDPDSGLWEFACLLTGVAPVRGEDGKLILQQDSGVILVLVPGGEAWIGAQSSVPDGPNFDPKAKSREGPPFRAALSPFFISKFELTQAQWTHVMGSNPSAFAWGSRHNPTLGDPWIPVENVTWWQCHEYLRRVGLTFPTVAQWEYAARAGTSTPWWPGPSPANLEGCANLADESLLQHEAWTGWPIRTGANDGWVVHAPVGSFRPNPFGLHDIHGNVWEWCLDSEDLEGLVWNRPANKDPHQFHDLSQFARRGGGFRDSPEEARSSHRQHDGAHVLDNDLGVRPSRGLEPIW